MQKFELRHYEIIIHLDTIHETEFETSKSRTFFGFQSNS